MPLFSDSLDGRRCCQLIGVDVLLDDLGDPYIIEINVGLPLPPLKVWWYHPLRSGRERRLHTARTRHLIPPGWSSAVCILPATATRLPGPKP
jgi:hypothetical protein